tara:strand:- start:30 stop:404 length:375 start_codon:yes stop_codon:yes gene_type:complete
MSTLEVSNLNDGTTTVATTFITNGSAKAWVNFAGAGTSINDSQNMSSLSDDATGKFTLTMSSAMGNTNYSVSQGIQELGTQNNHFTVVRSDVTITSTVFGVATYSSSSYQDVTLGYASVHGDLA